MKATSYRNSINFSCSNHISSSIVILFFQAQQMTSVVFIIHLSSLISCAFAFHFSLSWDLFCFLFQHGLHPVAKWWEFPIWSYVFYFLSKPVQVLSCLCDVFMGLIFRLCPFTWEMISSIYIFLQSSARKYYSTFIFFPFLRRAWAKKHRKMTSRPGIPRRSTCLVENPCGLASWSWHNQHWDVSVDGGVWKVSVMALIGLASTELK